MIKNIMKNIGLKDVNKALEKYKTDAKNMTTEQLGYYVEDLKNGTGNIGKENLEERIKIYGDELEARNPQHLEEEATTKKDIEQYMKAKRDIKKFEDTFKKQNEEYEARQRMGESASALSPLWGLKPNDYKNDPEYKKAVDIVKAFEA